MPTNDSNTSTHIERTKKSQQKKESNRVSLSSGDNKYYNNEEGKKSGSTAYVPPYCIWVEGDNPTNSRDSRSKDHGPVTKKLLVGIAEYRLWPPWRMGKLDQKKPNPSSDDDCNNIRQQE